MKSYLPINRQNESEHDNLRRAGGGGVGPCPAAAATGSPAHCAAVAAAATRRPSGRSRSGDKAEEGLVARYVIFGNLYALMAKLVKLKALGGCKMLTLGLAKFTKQSSLNLLISIR